MNEDRLLILNKIAQVIFDKKGMNILALDVCGFSTITDSVIIAEGAVDKHVVAIAQAIVDGMREIGEKLIFVEGMQSGDWIVLDFHGVMVHLFMPGLRDKYQLEQLWSAGKIVDLSINTARI
jgi:ribosome-associated protein